MWQGLRFNFKRTINPLIGELKDDILTTLFKASDVPEEMNLYYFMINSQVNEMAITRQISNDFDREIENMFVTL